ncbi:MAG: carboxypeptidase regulatory-like domain-containing protein [Rikenella sp.]|nr:carboxypeptidase regulatory-like domain-containing protein [Rikenella sp.]
MTKILFSLLLSVLYLSCSKDMDDTEGTATLFGVVSDFETGGPLSNVSIDLREGLAWDCLGATVGRTMTGNDGFFQIKGIDPDKSYFIIFQRKNYYQIGQRIRLAANKKTELNISMSK